MGDFREFWEECHINFSALQLRWVMLRKHPYAEPVLLNHHPLPSVSSGYL